MAQIPEHYKLYNVAFQSNSIDYTYIVYYVQYTFYTMQYNIQIQCVRHNIYIEYPGRK